MGQKGASGGIEKSGVKRTKTRARKYNVPKDGRNVRGSPARRERERTSPGAKEPRWVLPRKGEGHVKVRNRSGEQRAGARKSNNS